MDLRELQKSYLDNLRKVTEDKLEIGSSFLYSLLQGKEIIECLEFGSASASILISAHSCSDAMPSATQVEEFIKKSKEEYGEMVARV